MKNVMRLLQILNYIFLILLIVASYNKVVDGFSLVALFAGTSIIILIVDVILRRAKKISDSSFVRNILLCVLNLVIIIPIIFYFMWVGF
ncbi:hypothetical protein [Staphylococcus massiliensis]|uniref:Uncharacterized protein n=1 Tax=Staphylococcus massiliensis S46 TaxID=1229783 RepID=K9AKJ4_9STAP|nr:hypothetical protein [Staphylococcus massiliensis]EKU46601.1 hypothetical protein C273_09141 [Staphylococcus massiliensis S46]MCG3399633.1 hypothetical protein [Staphylococcus massiliensis]MCG3400738.1 hypothetical protein [Staphylococcus massiliensis]MCG3412097.1 hypothetical protein [Staphylococcus massiliensis]PNZ98661.1 hypothetical protein CD133_08130 [Staphylococcus massiliensis CCUG 55927]